MFCCVRIYVWRRGKLPTPVFLGFPCGSVGKESACNVGDLGSIPRLGRSPGEGKGYPLQYSGLENPLDSKFRGVTKSRRRLSDFHFHRTILFKNEIYVIFGKHAGHFFALPRALSEATTEYLSGLRAHGLSLRL